MFIILLCDEAFATPLGRVKPQRATLGQESLFDNISFYPIDNIQNSYAGETRWGDGYPFEKAESDAENGISSREPTRRRGREAVCTENEASANIQFSLVS